MNLLETKIETERLLLQPVAESDAADFLENGVADPRIQAWLCRPAPPDLAAELEWIRSVRAKMAAGECLTCAGFLRDSGELVGSFGFHEFGSNPSLGLWIRPELWGRGFGFEGVQALKTWARENLKPRPESLIYKVRVDNLASRRIAEKLGGELAAEFREISKFDGIERDFLEFRIPL